eukprot:6212735-Pleurochrysis_carterae.AAC.2
MEAGVTQECCVLLCACSQCAKRERDVSARVTCVEFFDGRHEPNRSVASVLGASVSTGAEERRHPVDEDTRLLQFTLMCRRHARESCDVIAVADGWRSTVRHVGLKEPADREGGARRRGNYRRVGSG